jgi:hypothetical protein
MLKDKRFWLILLQTTGEFMKMLGKGFLYLIAFLILVSLFMWIVSILKAWSILLLCLFLIGGSIYEVAAHNYKVFHVDED